MKKIYHNFIADTPAKYKQIQLIALAMIGAFPAFVESVPQRWIDLETKQFVVGGLNWVLVGITAWAGTKIETNEQQ